MSCFSSDGRGEGVAPVFPEAAAVGASGFVMPLGMVWGGVGVDVELNRTSGLGGSSTTGREVIRNTREQMRNCAAETRGFMGVVCVMYGGFQSAEPGLLGDTTLPA